MELKYYIQATDRRESLMILLIWTGVSARLCSYNARACVPSLVFRLVVHHHCEQGREGGLATSSSSSSYPAVVMYRSRSITTILSVDSSLTTWLVSDSTKHAGCRCEQSLSISISSQVEPQSPWIIIVRRQRKPSGLDLIVGLPARLNGLPLSVSRDSFPRWSLFHMPFLSISLPTEPVVGGPTAASTTAVHM